MVKRRNKGNLGFNRERFLEKHKNLHLKEKVLQIETRDPDFWKNLMSVKTHYEDSIEQYKNTLSLIINEISNADMNNPTIHSIRYRVKEVESLLIKIIEKSASVPAEPQGNSDIEKYRHITAENYYKIITDLIGVRILIRYRYQWEAVHNLIWTLYHRENHAYVSNWENDYFYDPAQKFIAEQPKAYIKQEGDRRIYESIGKNIFNILPSNNHYASLHYLVYLSGHYIEVQVRTIFDEAWCECSHDFVYKAQVSSQLKRDTLERLSTILAQHTTASEEIVSLMCDLATPRNAKRATSSTKTKEDKPGTSNFSQTFSSIKQRAMRLSQNES